MPRDTSRKRGNTANNTNSNMSPLPSAINTGENDNKIKNVGFDRTYTGQILGLNGEPTGTRRSYDVKKREAHDDIDYYKPFQGPPGEEPVLNKINREVDEDLHGLPKNYSEILRYDLLDEEMGKNFMLPREDAENRRNANTATRADESKNGPTNASTLREIANRSENANPLYSNKSFSKKVFILATNCWRNWCWLTSQGEYKKSEGGSKKMKGGHQVGGDYDEIRNFISERPYLEEILKGESCPKEIKEKDIEYREGLEKLTSASGINIEDLPKILYPNSYSEGGKRSKKTRKRSKKTRKPKQKRRTRRRT